MSPWKGDLRIRDRHPDAAVVDLVDERGEPVVLAVNRLVAAAIVERCSSDLERAVFQAGFKRGTQEGPKARPSAVPEFITDRDPGDEGPAEPKLYRNRCGWCGSFEGTVDPNEPCPIDEDGEPLGPHQFGVFEPLAAEPATTPDPEEADDVCPF